MAWKIIFKYKDGGQIKVSNNQKKLTKELAEYYQKQYSKPSNDGGVVYMSPYKTRIPVKLSDFIADSMEKDKEE